MKLKYELVGAGKKINKWSLVLRYIAWPYCMDSQAQSIDILLHKFFTHAANTNLTFCALEE